MEGSNNGQSHTQMSLEEYKKALLDYMNTKYPNITEHNERLVMNESNDYLTYLRDNYTPSVAAEGMLGGLL